MSTTTIEEYLPKTAIYINNTFDTDGRERGGHHNHVVTQAICNASPCLANKTASELDDFDNEMLSMLMGLDE